MSEEEQKDFPEYKIVKVENQEKKIDIERWERLNKISKDLVRNRMTNKQLADKYDVSTRQIGYDKRLIKEMETDKLRSQTLMEFCAEMLRTKEEVVDEFWNVVDEESDSDGNPFALIKALSKIAEMDRKYFNIVRDLGFMVDRSDSGEDTKVVEDKESKEQLKDKLKDLVNEVEEEDEEMIAEFREKVSEDEG